MSKGSPIVQVRIEPGLLHCIDTEIQKLNLRTKGEPYNRSSFIVKALKDKLCHIFRSRKEGKRPKKTLTEQVILP